MKDENKTKEKKGIYDLELHEVLEMARGISKFTITRVSGGWIYENYRLDAGQMTATFVPFNNEFQKTEWS